jgi:hypothetical protein
MHEQLALLVAPTGAMELFPHAVAVPLLQNVLGGHAMQPSASRMKPGRHAQDEMLDAPDGAKLLMGHLKLPLLQ